MTAFSPGHRLRLEACLTPPLLAALREQCRVLGIPLNRWHLVPSVARTWETCATCLLAERLQRDESLSWKDAVQAASIDLFLNPDTLQSRLFRFTKSAYKRAA